MRILSLHVEGFRSLKDVTWTPGPLNVIIGPNGTGKSNLLRLLEMISVSAQGRLGKHVQHAGGMDALVWDGQAEDIRVKFETPLLFSVFQVKRCNLTYEFRVQRLGWSSGYWIANELLARRYLNVRGKKPTPLKLLEREGNFAKMFDNKGKGIIIPGNSLQEEETLLSLPAMQPPSQNLITPSFRKNLANWSIYQDLRVDQDAAIRMAAVARADKRVDPDGQNLINVLHTLYTSDRGFRDDINTAMKVAFGDEFEELNFPPAADQRIQLRLRWKSLKRAQSAADLSDGTLRFLYLLAILASPDPAPLIAIDEPETGLHPSMLPIIADFAVQASARSQVIFTTHSPAMLDAFRDTIPTTTFALWEDGQTQLHTPPKDVLDYWLKEYSLGKLFTSGELEQLGRGEA